ncbi:MAG: dTMP kinase [Sedimentisphaerales bacterium]|nr:dTMP kinase [Sedimentisphaerales bacterium]
MSWEKLKGKFIVLDGPDGSGKSTQIELLARTVREKGVKTLVLRDPGGTVIGEEIRQILLNPTHEKMSVRCETLLYMASRAELFSQCIEPALEKEWCVLCDRWISSTYAYQAVAGDDGKEFVLELAETALQRTWPDRTIIIDVPTEISRRRLGDSLDRMEAKSESFHRKVRDAFLELAKGRSDFEVIDGTGSIEQIHKQVIEALGDYVNS